METRHPDEPTPPTGPRPESAVRTVWRWTSTLLALGLLGSMVFHIAVPSFHTGDCGPPGRNERAAIATLMSLESAQEQFRSDARLDRDADGVGEFGYLAELVESGEDDGGYLPSTFAKAFPLPGGGTAIRRSGYVFQMVLPGTDGAGIPESHPVTALPDPDRAERAWCCLAWPEEQSDAGRRAFFVDESGDIWWLGNEGPTFTGTDRTPAFDATFVHERAPTLGPVAPADSTRRHGHTWERLHRRGEWAWSYFAEEE